MRAPELPEMNEVIAMRARTAAKIRNMRSTVAGAGAGRGLNRPDTRRSQSSGTRRATLEKAGRIVARRGRDSAKRRSDAAAQKLPLIER